MKIGIIGLGNMSEHIIKGYHNQNYPFEIIASTRTKKYLPYKITYLNDNQDCINQSDIIMIGVRPEDIKSLNIHDFQNKPIISMAAKYPFSELKNTFKNNPLIRIMPNLNVAINQGDISVSFHNCDENLKEKIIKILEPLGRIYPLSEHKISGFVGLSGSAPAFVYSFIESMSTSCIAEGFTEEEATNIVTNMTKASAEYLIESKLIPNELINKISSKGGTTYEGMQSLDKDGFNEIIHKAVKAVVEKDKKG